MFCAGLSSRAVEQIRELHARTGSSGDATTSTMLDDSSQALQDLGDAMDVDAGEYEDEDGDMNEDVLHALRDFLGDRCVRPPFIPSIPFECRY